MANQSQLNNHSYKNWIKAGLGLKYGKEIFHTFLFNSLTNFRSVNLSFDSTQNCNQCTLLNVLPCPTNGICSRDNKGRCRQHNTLDKAKTSTQCTSNVCDKLQQAIAQEHIPGKGPRWIGSDPQQWCSNVWEIAKCFMPAGNETKHDYSEFDFSGIITMIMNAKFIQHDLPAPYNAKTYQKVCLKLIMEGKALYFRRDCACAGTCILSK